jgi:hypothetical protein
MIRSKLTDGKLLLDLVDEIVVGLFHGVVSVGEDSSKARFAIATKLNRSVVDVVEVGDGDRDDN